MKQAIKEPWVCTDCGSQSVREEVAIWNYPNDWRAPGCAVDLSGASATGTYHCAECAEDVDELIPLTEYLTREGLTAPIDLAEGGKP